MWLPGSSPAAKCEQTKQNDVNALALAAAAAAADDDDDDDDVLVEVTVVVDDDDLVRVQFCVKAKR